MSTKRAHHFNRARIPVIGITSRPYLGNSNLGVTAARPVDNEHDLISFGIVVDDDFLNEDARQSLSGTRIRIGSIPSCWQIVSKSKQSLSINLGPLLRFCFEIMDAAL
jgi:hypothetical protein